MLYNFVFFYTYLFFTSSEDFFCGECYRLIEFLKMKPVKKKGSEPEWLACYDLMFVPCFLENSIMFMIYISECFRALLFLRV